ncbi:hypothetical protein [Streptomyces sp. NPDC047097]|uniref:hypothetical protein n=1 Tax=Streptomyces sp. NPDC047097 TaxID=3155260 RepID=UPI00340895B8
MSAEAVEITPVRSLLELVPVPPFPAAPAEPAGLVVVDDVESLTGDAVPGCNDDNPYI